MLKHLKPVLLGCLVLAVATPAPAQVKQSRDQILFYTSQFKGERFADGRPKVSDDLLKREVDVSIEDLWDYLRDKGYNCRYRTGSYSPCRADNPKGLLRLPDAASGEALCRPRLDHA